MKNLENFFYKANILIVHEYFEDSRVLIKFLNYRGYINIKSVKKSESIIKSIKENIPDMILININLDAINGYELCEVIRKDEDLIDVPIIFINTGGEAIDRNKIYIVGGNDYLSTPLEYEEVINRIEMHLRIKFMEYKIKFHKGNYDTTYTELKSWNRVLLKRNSDLVNEVIEKDNQLDEITFELKEFNIILEEEMNERTRTEEALKESERQLRHSIEEAPVPIMLYTEDGFVKKINRSWSDITGYKLEDIPTISEWADISEAFKEELSSTNIKKLFNSEKRQNNGEFSIRAHDGSIRICNFYSAYIGDLEDGHKLFMKVAIDVTEKKHMEELQKSVEEERKKLYEIKEYDRIRTEFFSNISHELRTPINVIYSALQMHELRLKDCIFENRSIDKYKYTKIMKQNCYRILRLINNIIDITKIDSGYFNINEHNIDIIALIENITLSVADYIENKGLSLIFDTNVEEKIMSCDPEKIERIILNILSNAVKFTSSGGKITVSIEECYDRICIKIKDTGRGIPQDKLNSIFERFIQVDKSLTRDHEGSGIGLSLVKSLVELHGGVISVKSKISCGTEFVIYIPCKLVKNAEEQYSLCSSIGGDCIEKINIEFSDIYN
ncbi:ATP-binding protein [Clostridium beijerinckii]|uniref:Stage 0 sporulation protein A homolog n=1 Tax=Clostridium beijerinckii TaxID=1520 RepID=A0AAE5LRR7_CLOBE|nr:ATP-binding protein [Clostridium beijerinckii]NSB16019.1 PAS domain S-box-containing protein [Clostridium beijerinckii]OOM33347.1 sensor histidine kinase TmoS [Clostridium beijerinckii]